MASGKPGQKKTRGRRRPQSPEVTTRRIGTDTGGTFSDFVSDDGRILKLPSSAAEPGKVLVEGLSKLIGDEAAAVTMVHGTTVATNALLTGNTAAVGVLITRGFRDILHLGRQNRPRLYELEPTRTFSSPESRLVQEISERMSADGTVLMPLDDDEVVQAGNRLVRSGAESLAVCFLHSYINPEHEQRAARLLKFLGVPVSLSSGLCAEFREFERFSTACGNASLRPLVEDYMQRVGAALGSATRLLVMQSQGGTTSAETASREPIRLVLSGPAGGLVGSLASVATPRRRRLLTLDMGGTSTDVACLDGDLPRRSSVEVRGRTYLVPVLDVVTVGAGGGSIARVDHGGALVVGPASAGADPGPACYGRGGPATVTDANVVLGRIPPGRFLGGAMTLDRDAAFRAVNQLAENIGLSAEETAAGILEIAEVTMLRALRSISLERGHDPRRDTLVAFGGAGGLHAARLARHLELSSVVVPRDAGTLSAFGMLCARASREVSRTVHHMSLDELSRRADPCFGPLEDEARGSLERDGVTGALLVERLVDIRCVGQSFELSVPWLGIPRTSRAFAVAHRKYYGFLPSDAHLEVVTLRIRMSSAATPRPPAAKDPPRRRSKHQPVEKIPVYVDGSQRWVPVLERRDVPGSRLLAGPLIVVDYSSTTWVPPDFSCRREPSGHLNLVMQGGGR